jgi:hypothetical protein
MSRCNISRLRRPCCTGASCVPVSAVTWSGLDKYHLIAVGLWPDLLQLHGGMLHCSCSLQVEVGDLPLSPRGQGWVLYACMGCMQNFGRPRGETLALADLQVYNYHCLPVALIWVKSQSQRIGQSHSQRSWELRINSQEHFKLGQELSFE